MAIPKHIVCSSCNKHTQHAARGLCSKCYYKQYKKDMQKAYPSLQPRAKIIRNLLYAIRTADAYSISYEQLHMASVLGCEICGNTHDLVIDHNHDTGKFRGLLCRKHNSALGLLDDDLSLVVSAKNYLEQNNASNEKTFLREVHRPRDFIRERY